MTDRDKFIADMILELSRQQKEDVETFNKPRSLTEKEVFQKMCFSFPIVSSEDIQKLELAIDKTVSGKSIPFCDAFCLDDTFLENVVSLSEKHEAGSSHATQSIAALIYLKYPDFLLRCNKQKLSALFSNNVNVSVCDEWSIPNSKRHDMKWNSIFAAFRSLIMRSNSSLLSNLPAKSFVDSSHLNSLQSTISTLDKLVQLLSAADTSTPPVNSVSTPDGTPTKSDAEIESEFLTELDNDGDHSLTLEEVFRRVVKEVLTVSTVHTVTDHGSIASMCKEMWLHCIFLYRDILIRMPVLINAYLPLLCDVLLSTNTSSSSSSGKETKSTPTNPNAMTDLFSFKPKSVVSQATRPYPSSSECMFVMTVGNIATFLTAPTAVVPTSTTTTVSSTDATISTGNGNVAVSDAQQLSSSREAMRGMLTSKGRLTSLVDICERMTAGHTPVRSERGSVSTRSVVDVESTTFLLDVCTLYTADLRNGSYTYNTTSSSGSTPSLSASKHFEALVTSRALAVLVAALVGCVERAAEWITLTVSSVGKTESIELSAVSRAAQSNLSALCSRLIKFFSYSALHSPAVCSYLLTSTDFIPSLTTLNQSWSNLLGVLRTDQSRFSAKYLDDTLNVFAPSEAVSLLSVLLLLSANNASVDVSVSELMFSLLEHAVQLVSHFQLPFHSTPVTATESKKTLESEDYVVIEGNTSSNEVSITTEVANEVDTYTPEEVAEKESSVASGLARHRFISRTAQRMAQSVELLVSEADGAGLVRTLFRNKTPTVGSVTERTQRLLKDSVVKDMLRLVASQLSTIASIEEESHKQASDVLSVAAVSLDEKKEVESPSAEESSTTSTTTNRATLPVVNVTTIRGAHESLKKQLKALQSLIEGHASSKAD